MRFDVLDSNCLDRLLRMILQTRQTLYFRFTDSLAFTANNLDFESSRIDLSCHFDSLNQTFKQSTLQHQASKRNESGAVLLNNQQTSRSTGSVDIPKIRFLHKARCAKSSYVRPRSLSSTQTGRSFTQSKRPKSSTFEETEGSVCNIQTTN